MKFSVMFFSSGEGESAAASYDAIREIARFADREGFARVWLPERHFVPFGALHPNPAVLAAAVACDTTRVRIAAGSIVAPLHDPIRIAEEWAVVDNLSRGRVDAAFASGWRAGDFALAPGDYGRRREILRGRVADVRTLWRGGTIERRLEGGAAMPVATYPRPVQRELPIWITAARAVETFALAGELGANVLTYLVDVGLDGLAERVAVYRAARARAGLAPDAGAVTVMLHTYVGPDSAAARAQAEPAYRRYLVENRSLVAPGRRGGAVSREDAERVAEAQFARMFESLSLVGSVEGCVAPVEALAALGVDEIACLVDFIDDFDAVRAALPFIADLRSRVEAPPAAGSTRRAPEAEPIEPAGDARAGRRDVARARADASRDDTSRPYAVDRSIESPPVEAGAEEFYAYIESIGGSYGPSFRLLERVVADEERAVAHLRAPDGGNRTHARALLTDAAIATAHAIGMTPGLRASSRPLGLPIALGRGELADVASDRYVVRTTRVKGDGDAIDFDVEAATADGRPALRLSGLRFGRLQVGASDPRELAARALIHDQTWEPLPGASGNVRRGAAPPESAAVSAANASDARALVAALRAHGWNAAPDEGPAVAGGARILLAHAGCDWRVGDLAAPRAAVARVAAWFDGCSSDDAPLVVLVRGANRVGGGDPAPDPVAAAAWAAAASLSAEKRRRVTLVDLDPRLPVADGIPSLAAVVAHAGGRMVAVRDDTIHTQAFLPRPADDAPGDQVPIAGSRVLITGGTGALGRALAAWLVEEGARHVRLVSRRASHAGRFARALAARAATELVDADVGDRTGAARAAAPVDFLFHLAGDVVDAAGTSADEATIDRCFRPKLDGLVYLHDALAEAPPRRVVVFSTIAALGGSAGQCAYAAANAAMAAAAERLPGFERAGVRVIWFGPWSGAGMSAGAHVEALVRAKGLEPMPPWDALRALGAVLASPATTAVVGIRAGAPRAGAPPAATAREAPAAPSPALAALLDRLREASPAARAAIVEEEIVRQVACIMELEPARIDPGRSLYDIGFDSLMAIELKNVVLVEYAVEIGLADLMKANTIADMTRTLVPVLSAMAAAEERGPAAPTPALDEAPQELIL